MAAKQSAAVGRTEERIRVSEGLGIVLVNQSPVTSFAVARFLEGCDKQFARSTSRAGCRDF